jgi:hypothetical protein
LFFFSFIFIEWVYNNESSKFLLFIFFFFIRYNRFTVRLLFTIIFEAKKRKQHENTSTPELVLQRRKFVLRRKNPITVCGENIRVCYSVPHERIRVDEQRKCLRLRRHTKGYRGVSLLPQELSGVTKGIFLPHQKKS